jgi:DNA-binding SARP family transcriptional activator
MDPTYVFSAKVRRPPPAGLARDRLLRRLLDPATDLAVIVAPAGSGKTTLLAQVAAEAGMPVGWYRAGPEDGTEVALVRHLVRALDLGGAGRTTLAELLLALEGRPGRWLLVLDDLHDLEGTAAEAAIERLVDLRPPGLRMVLSSRRPVLNLSRLQVSGGLHEIGADDLRFRSWEVEQLFGRVYGEPLPPESSAALCRRTGGWAAALQLFHLATSGKSVAERVRVVSSLSAQSRLIRPYLTRNVLAELPDPRRRFLVHTAALGVLTGPLCDALLGTTGSAAVLRELEQGQLFTIPLDDGETYRYHQVLQSHLENALVEELGTAGAGAWYAHAAAVLEAAGATGEALLAYARAEDWGAVARLLQRRGPGVTSGVGHAWDEMLPATMWTRDAWLALAEANRRLRHGALPDAVEALRLAEGLFEDAAGRERCRRQRAAATTWLPGEGTGADPGTRAAHWAERVRAATRRAAVRATLDPAPSDGDRLEAGLTHLLAGRFISAAEALRPLADRAIGADLALFGRAALVVADVAMGQTADAASRLEDVAMGADVEGHAWLGRVTRILLAAVLRSGGATGYDDADPPDPWAAALGALAGGISAGLGGGAPTGAAWGAPPGDEAPALLDDAATRFRALDAPVLAVWADAVGAFVRARSAAAGADDGAARAEVESRALSARGAQAFALAALAITRADRRPTIERAVRDIASECGIPAALLLPPVTGPGAPRVAIAPSRLVRIGVFGGFRLLLGSELIELAGLRPRARTLLRLLAASYNTPVHRERLVDALWPGADLTGGLRRLHVAVSMVRHALDGVGLPGQGVLERCGDTYRLDVAGAQVDLVDHHEALLAAAAARAAGDVEGAVVANGRVLGSYAGDLLPEDGPAEWVVPERDRLRLLTAAAAEDLANGCRTLGRLADAVAAARRALALEPFRDPAWRLIAELHEASGDAGAAAYARREHARLVAELEGDPAPPVSAVSAARRVRAASAMSRVAVGTE